MIEERDPRGNTAIEFIACPSCKQPAVSGGVCYRCGWMDASGAGSPAAVRPPAGMVFEPRSSAFTLKRRWWKSKITLYVIFLLIVLLCLAMQQLYNGIIESGGVNIWSAAVLVVLLYVLVALLVNRTAIRVSPGRLEVARGPLYLPLTASFSLNRNEIQRLDTFREEVHTRGSTDTTYVLKVVTDKNSTRNIVEYDDKGEADRLYQFLQKTLQIDYKPERMSEEAVGALIGSPAAKASLMYRIVLLGLVVLNVFCLWLNTAWRFDAGYWVTFGATTLGAFVVFVVHHRKHLSIWDSKPLSPGEHGAGVAAYLIMTPLLTLILTPLIMVLYGLIRRVGGL